MSHRTCVLSPSYSLWCLFCARLGAGSGARAEDKHCSPPCGSSLSAGNWRALGGKSHTQRGAENAGAARRSRRDRCECRCPRPPEPQLNITCCKGFSRNRDSSNACHSGVVSTPVGTVIVDMSIRRYFQDLCRTLVTEILILDKELGSLAWCRALLRKAEPPPETKLQGSNSEKTSGRTSSTQRSRQWPDLPRSSKAWLLTLSCLHASPPPSPIDICFCLGEGQLCSDPSNSLGSEKVRSS